MEADKYAILRLDNEKKVSIICIVFLKKIYYQFMMTIHYGLKITGDCIIIIRKFI